MTFYEFISDRLSRVILELLIMTFMSVVLLSTGTQADVMILLLIIVLLIRTTALMAGFFKCRSHLQELESILSGLDQKYLFAECVPPPETTYERRLFSMMRRSLQSMTGAVSDAQAAVRDYREYVESWVHEIKSPLTAAGLICHTLDAESKRRLAPELAQMEAHVERALFYARAESPDRDFIIRECSLWQIVSETIDTYRTLLVQNNMCIETDHLEHQIYTDDKWTRFILGQLLQNAARYKKNCDTSVMVLSAECTDSGVALTVQDQGIGIPTHELPRVFDRGFTGSNGRAKGGSTGMGLYLCRRLCGFLGIDIHLASVWQEGTCVTLIFPVKN